MSAFASSSGHTSARAFSSFVPIGDLSRCSNSLPNSGLVQMTVFITDVRYIQGYAVSGSK